MNAAAGDELPLRTVTVRREAMKTVAVMLRDPNPIHWDLDTLRELGLGERPINQGPTNLAYVWDALAAWTGSSCLVKDIGVRFMSNALAGEELNVGGRVEWIDELSGLASYSVWLRHRNGTPVLEGTATVWLR